MPASGRRGLQRRTFLSEPHRSPSQETAERDPGLQRWGCGFLGNQSGKTNGARELPAAGKGPTLAAGYHACRESLDILASREIIQLTLHLNGFAEPERWPLLFKTQPAFQSFGRRGSPGAGRR